jgi:hypothetical protein
MGASLLPLTAGAQSQIDQTDLYADSTRPVAEAVGSLISQYPQVVTYEDPRYMYEGDIKDATFEVRRDVRTHGPGQASKTLVPMGGSLDLTYTVSGETGEPEDWPALLQKLLDEHDVGASGGRFRLEWSGRAFHVIPAETRNAAGEWVPESPVLDVRINLADKERDGIQMLEAITDAVSEATQARVVVGTIPTNLFAHHRGNLKAENETARTVLMRALNDVAGGAHLTWFLFYGPGEPWYVLNIRGVARKSQSSNSPLLEFPGDPSSPLEERDR